jgi:hypothetical protein
MAATLRQHRFGAHTPQQGTRWCMLSRKQRKKKARASGL